MVMTEVVSVDVAVLVVVLAALGCWSVLSSAVQCRRRTPLLGVVQGQG